MSRAPVNFGNFDLIKRYELDYTDVVVSKWQSRCTGLNVLHLDYEAPLVNGYFVLATEIFNDSGCPHTLEHLIFMGSEKYPYKGILDLFANRGFSNGTNAWTDIDHTAYTLSTAGEQGFLQLLPIYMDHILCPTLTEASFLTEVHHIDGKGQDSGVVYSEMQGRENTSGDLVALRSQRLLNPPGSAYRSETGGLMHALRVLTLEQIRSYHKNFYVPHNLSLIVCGKFLNGTLSLLETLQRQVEPHLISRGENKGPRPPGWKRPFVETQSAIRPSIPKVTKSIVEFPERDESMGELLINVQGPSPTAFLERKGLDILGTYLTSSPIAPLNKEFVEIDSPLCSYILFGEESRASCVDLPIYVGSVPTEHLADFDTKLHTSLKHIVNDGIDMERMGMIINRDQRQFRSKLESAKGETFSGALITDFLYCAQDGSQIRDSMDDINQYSTLKTWTSKKWTDLLQKYYVDRPFLVIIGKPSEKLFSNLELEEKARISNQVQKMCPEGLKNAEAELQAAKADHARPIPTDLLTSFPVPSVKSISWISVKSVQEPGIGKERQDFQNCVGMNSSDLASHIGTDGSPLPFFVHYDHVQSDFISITATLSLDKLPARLRPYMSAYMSAFFSLPVVRKSGEKLTHEDVINRLENETVFYEIGLGISTGFTDVLRVTIKVESELYETGIIWLKDLLFSSEFDVERLQVVIAKIQQSLPEQKREGTNVLASLHHELIFSEDSTLRAGSILSQADFIPKLGSRIRDDPDQVIADFKDIRRFLTDPKGLRFSVAGNVLGLLKPRSLWGKHFAELNECELDAVPIASHVLSSAGKNPVRKALVTSLPTIESTYVTHTTKTIQGFVHPEYPQVRVALEVLNATESYLWRYIRGSGLAYGAYISLDLEAGLLSFTLYRSSNSTAAFQEAAKVLRGLSDGSIPLEATTLDAAKSSIVYDVAKSVSTAGRAALVSFTNQALRGVSKTHQIDLLNKYQAVTKSQVLEVMRKYFLPLFDPLSSVAVVVASQFKSPQIKDDLKLAGFDVEQRCITFDSSDEQVSESGTESDSIVDDA